MMGYPLAGLAPFVLLFPLAPMMRLSITGLLLVVAFWRAKRWAWVVLVFASTIAVFAPLLAPFGLDERVAVSDAFPLGVDTLERDRFSLLLHGHRTSVLIALAGAATACLLGTLIGAVQAWLGGPIRRAIDVLFQAYLSIPGLIYVLIALAFLPRGPLTLIGVLAFVLWPETARLVQARIESLRGTDFVAAARMRGARERDILFGEILPNLVPLIGTSFLIAFAAVLLAEAALGYLNLGHEVGTPSLGRLIDLGIRRLDDEPALFLSAIVPFIGWLAAARALASRGRGDQVVVVVGGTSTSR